MTRAAVRHTLLRSLAVSGPSAEPSSAPTMNIRPEAELLICCALVHMNPERADRIRALLQEKIDWTYLFRIAVSHRMMPLLYWHLNATCPEAVPEFLMNYLRDYFSWNTRRDLYLTGELCRTLQLFEANGIPAIPFRGPVLMSSVYGNLALREFLDLVILVHEHDVKKASQLLISQGYRPRLDLTRGQQAAFLGYQSEQLFLRSEDRVIVKIRWRIAPRYFLFESGSERLWERVERLSIGGMKVLALSPEDLVLVLCLHGAQCLWKRLELICDVAELIHSHKRMDWSRIMDEASTLRIERMLFLGLYLARDLLGADLPEEVWQRMQPLSVVTSLGAKVRERLFLRDDHGPPEVMESCLFHLELMERLRDKVRYCYGVAITPSVEDLASLPLPARFSLLYYLLRPIQLVLKYGFGLLKRPSLDLAPYDPTPMELVERMLALAEVRSTDVVYDLGCGDGQIVITAAKRYGARGVGVDIDPKRVAEAKANACKEGVAHLVTFIQQDAKIVDVSQATVVMLYLSPTANLKLRQTLQGQLRPGARVVSRRYDMADWLPDRSEIIDDATAGPNMLYLWRIAKPPNRLRCD